MIRNWGVLLPERSDLPAPPRGVVLHWTGGGPTANEVDLAAYHYVVDHDGKVRQGKWPVAANMRKLEGSAYAHHTGAFNSYRVGISGAGMRGYESPRNPGSYMLREFQVRTMCELAAYFVWLGGLDPADPAHLCSHQEVWTRLGVRGQTNHTKRDIEYLDYRTDLKPPQVGEYLRFLAEQYIDTVLNSYESRALPVLRQGATGEAVGRLQNILGIRGPDVYGPLTYAALIAFQRAHGLSPDGIVGPKTWRLLLHEERRKAYRD